jgi:hypothetical protein
VWAIHTRSPSLRSRRQRERDEQHAEDDDGRGEGEEGEVPPPLNLLEEDDRAQRRHDARSARDQRESPDETDLVVRDEPGDLRARPAHAGDHTRDDDRGENLRSVALVEAVGEHVHRTRQEDALQKEADERERERGAEKK